MNILMLTNGLIAFFITIFCILICRRPAFKIGLVDNPGGRKQHIGPVPLIGGICMFLGFCFAVLTLDISLVQYRSLLAGSGLLVLVGVIDDMHELTPQFRLLAQLIAALLMAFWGGVILSKFGSFFTLAIGLFIPQIVVAEITWGFALVFIMFLFFSHH